VEIGLEGIIGELELGFEVFAVIPKKIKKIQAILQHLVIGISNAVAGSAFICA